MRTPFLAACLVLTLPAAADTGLKLDPKAGAPINVAAPGLYPEGIEFNPLTGEFLLGSIRKGEVVAVTPGGAVRPFVEDQRLRSVVGIRVDAAHRRLLVTSSDFGVAERSLAADQFAVAALGVYDLKNGAALQFIDLSQLRPKERAFVNDLDVDASGNVYLTDSLSAAILKVTPSGEASVFLTHESFRGAGFTLNGIQVHEGGFLLVVKKSDGKLFRIPLDHPATFSEVKLPEPLVGGDGLVLVSPRELVVIANRAGAVVANQVYTLVSDDNWQSARIAEKAALEDTYATTGVKHDGRVFVSNGWLHQLGETLKNKQKLRQVFQIQEIGRVR